MTLVALEFDELLIIRPIPASAALQARQASLIQRRLTAAGSLDQVRAEALAAINITKQTDEPSEIKRLRLLYQQVYTQNELSAFVQNSLAELGFKA